MSRQFLFIWTLLMGATLGWMFWPEDQTGLGDVLAVLKARQGNVQVRRSGSFTWIKGVQGNGLFALDSIATEAASKAVIQLADGTEIILPPDTQLKIQPQLLSEGVEIAVVKGGVSVQKPKMAKTKGAGKGAGGIAGGFAGSHGVGKGSLVSIQTSRFKIDLSALKGTFSLGADAAVKADQPESVVVNSQQNSLNLAQLNKEGDSVLDSDHNDAIFEVQELPKLAPPPPPTPVVLAEAPKPKPKPKLILQAKPLLKPLPPPEPVALALVEEDGDLVFPEWKLERNQIWIGGAFERNERIPIAIPAVWTMTDRREKWDTVLRISSPVNAKSLVIRKQIGPEGFTFSLSELRSLVTNLNVDVIDLTLQAGLVRKTEDGKVARFAPGTLPIQLHALNYKVPVVVTLEKLEFVDPNGKWFAGSSPRQNKIVLYLLDPSLLSQLEGFLRGSISFTVKPSPVTPNHEMLGLVKGPKLVMLSDSLSSADIKALALALQLDLVFSGEPQDFLGGKGNFDLMAYLEQSSDVFYIRRGLSLKLDAQLFKTQAAARDFIRKFNPYFFKKSVSIKYASET